MDLPLPSDGEALLTQISQQLSETEYAVSSLTKLTGGTVNFVFRGILTRSSYIEDRKLESVIFKHSRSHLSTNNKLLLDISRSNFEQYILKALNDFSVVCTRETLSVDTPKLHMWLSEYNIQVMQDVPDARTLTSIVVSPTADAILNKPYAASIGYALGRWLRDFHDWTSAPPQAELSRKIRENEAMRKLKSQITYESFINVLRNFPDLLEGHIKAFEEVRGMAEVEFAKTAQEGEVEDWGIIHGDFWGGNVLIPNSVIETQGSEDASIFVIDWEFAQYGHRAYDLGQMIGDLYERKHFHGTHSPLRAIEAFIDGYGPVTEEMAFRIAIHTGIHLICWYTRRAPDSPLPFLLEQVTELMKLGRDFVVKGWEADGNWFQQTFLAPLFP